MDYPVLQKMLYNVYMARKCHFTVAAIGNALSTSYYEDMFKFAKVQDYHQLIGERLYQDLGKCDHSSEPILASEGLVDIEKVLQVKRAKVFDAYREKLKDDPEYACCSCERLLTKSSVKQLTADTQKFSPDQWTTLKAYLALRDDNFNSKIYYVCIHCYPWLNKNILPDRCVLNRLYVEPVQQELSGLNALGRQLIQRAKCFQTVIRLGMYTGKVPIYNATRALKGTTFFLSLPVQDTIDKLNTYTIRQMDEKLPVGSDLDLYKMLKVHEPALDSRLKFLDVMCISTLFPTGQFGEFDPREITLLFSEHVKSCLLNQDSRFHKSPEFVFFYFWQKQLKELFSGICNVMKRVGKHNYVC